MVACATPAAPPARTPPPVVVRAPAPDWQPEFMPAGHTLTLTSPWMAGGYRIYPEGEQLRAEHISPTPSHVEWCGDGEIMVVANAVTYQSPSTARRVVARGATLEPPEVAVSHGRLVFIDGSRVAHGRCEGPLTDHPVPLFGARALGRAVVGVALDGRTHYSLDAGRTWHVVDVEAVALDIAPTEQIWIADADGQHYELTASGAIAGDEPPFFGESIARIRDLAQSPDITGLPRGGLQPSDIGTFFRSRLALGHSMQWTRKLAEALLGIDEVDRVEAYVASQRGEPTRAELAARIRDAWPHDAIDLVGSQPLHSRTHSYACFDNQPFVRRHGRYLRDARAFGREGPATPWTALALPEFCDGCDTRPWGDGSHVVCVHDAYLLEGDRVRRLPERNEYGWSTRGGEWMFSAGACHEGPSLQGHHPEEEGDTPRFCATNLDGRVLEMRSPVNLDQVFFAVPDGLVVASDDAHHGLLELDLEHAVGDVVHAQFKKFGQSSRRPRALPEGRIGLLQDDPPTMTIWGADRPPIHRDWAFFDAERAVRMEGAKFRWSNDGGVTSEQRVGSGSSGAIQCTSLDACWVEWMSERPDMRRTSQAWGIPLIPSHLSDAPRWRLEEVAPAPRPELQCKPFDDPVESFDGFSVQIVPASAEERTYPPGPSRIEWGPVGRPADRTAELPFRNRLLRLNRDEAWIFTAGTLRLVRPRRPDVVTSLPGGSEWSARRARWSGDSYVIDFRENAGMRGERIEVGREGIRSRRPMLSAVLQHRGATRETWAAAPRTDAPRPPDRVCDADGPGTWEMHAMREGDWPVEIKVGLENGTRCLRAISYPRCRMRPQHGRLVGACATPEKIEGYRCELVLR